MHALMMAVSNMWVDKQPVASCYEKGAVVLTSTLKPVAEDRPINQPAAIASAPPRPDLTETQQTKERHK